MKTIDDFGFDCEIAENGKITVEKIERKEFDVVLMDLQMPMNGFEATEYIRNTMKSSIQLLH
jgi:CheY-like chemotaxis protein